MRLRSNPLRNQSNATGEKKVMDGGLQKGNYIAQNVCGQEKEGPEEGENEDPVTARIVMDQLSQYVCLWTLLQLPFL